MANIIDSAMNREGILAQNPHSIAPEGILHTIHVLDVVYFGYDAHIHRGQIAMHEQHVEDVQRFFECALDIQFPIEKVIPISHAKYHWDDELSCTDNNSSGFNYRIIMGTQRLSNHANGCAFDINPAHNIYIRYDAAGNEIYRLPKNGTYNEKIPGTLTAYHELVLLMKHRGWIWGGDWTKESGRVDYQHFEKHIVS